jgi:hypothetical protein
MSERPTDRHSHGQQHFGNSPITGGRSSRLALLRVAEALRGGADATECRVGPANFRRARKINSRKCLCRKARRRDLLVFRCL